MAEGAPDFSHLSLFETERWKVGLHPKQTYLGRSVAVLKRKLQDPLECTPEEQLELWTEILPRYREVITETFQPVRINYAHLANDYKQVHWHLVPRYEEPRSFAEVEFIDPKPGHNYSPHPDVPAGFSDAKLSELVDELRGKFA